MIEIDDFDFCKGCKLVDEYNKLDEVYSLNIEVATKLEKENKQLKERIDKAIEYINSFECIRAYFEYAGEDGYSEYDYNDNFKKDILEILKGEE